MQPYPPNYPQAPAPQGYPAAPAAYPPPPAPMAPQGYPQAPAPQAYAPAPVAPQAPAQPAGDAFNAPANTGFGMVRPRMEDLNPNLYPGQMGRLVMFAPTKLEVDKPIHANTPGYQEMVARNNGVVPKKDVVTANLIVLDGGPLAMGGKPEKGTPHTVTHDDPSQTCYVGMQLNQTILVDQTRPSVNPSGGSLVLGRLTKVPTQGTPAWKLSDPTEQDRAIARAWCAANPGPWSQPPAAYVSRIPVTGNAPVGTPMPAPQAPAQAAPQGYGQPAYGPPPQAAPAPNYPPPPPPAPVYAPPAAPANPGYDPAWWATLDPQAQAYYASQPLPQAAPTGPTPGTQASWA